MVIRNIFKVLPLFFCVLTAVASENDATLTEQLQERKAAYQKRAPKSRMEMVKAAIQELRNSGILESALNIGDKAPDFILKDPLGKEVVLSELLAEGPVILTWYRGNWCPYCNLQLRDYQKKLSQIRAAGGQLVAISPETPDNALTMEEKNDLQFKVVSDLGNRVAKEYGIVYRIPDNLEPLYGKDGLDLAKYNGDDSMELPLGVTYIVNTQGVIDYAFVSADYTERAETNDVIAALQKIER